MSLSLQDFEIGSYLYWLNLKTAPEKLPKAMRKLGFFTALKTVFIFNYIRMEKRFVNRLTRDLQTMEKNYKEQFPVYRPNDDLKVWHVTLFGAKGSIYEGEKYT